MQMAQILGGYSLGGADLLRRAMGKKKAEEMAEHREIFREGAAKNGIGDGKGRRDLRPDGEVRGLRLQQVARRRLLAAGVPHRLAEGALHGRVLLRQHDAGNGRHRQAQDPVRGRAEELRHHLRAAGRQPRPLPLRAGRRQGRSATAWARSRARASRRSRRSSRRAKRAAPSPACSTSACAWTARRINKRTVEALIKAGAFDSLQLNRASLIASIDRAFDFANATEANANQGGLFDMGDSHAASTQEPPLVEATPWGVKERLTLREDGDRLLPVGPPVRRGRAGGAALRQAPIDDLIDTREPQLLAGIVSDFRVINGQRGKLALFKLDDKSDAIEATADEARDQRQPQPAQGRRTGHRDGQAAARPLLGRLPPERQPGLGPGDGALPLRQVPARGRQRQGAGHRAAGARLSAQARESEQGELVRGLGVRLCAGARRPWPSCSWAKRRSSSRPMRRWPAGWRRPTKAAHRSSTSSACVIPGLTRDDGMTRSVLGRIRIGVAPADRCRLVSREASLWR